ncbi:hypothetical protein CDAR_400211 [Caerostris darwini]|uniref:Uncharacterized protein n=1 Tax=Caerostris darwini TaxID=1538125 RepID=A0AAV4SC43_9ARAC|nr:hypothetical protein CDAR_400211 [Caerostris darwini]
MGKTGSSLSRGTAPFPGVNEECRRGSLCAKGWPLSVALCLRSVIANIIVERINHNEVREKPQIKPEQSDEFIIPPPPSPCANTTFFPAIHQERRGSTPTMACETVQVF